MRSEASSSPRRAEALARLAVGLAAALLLAPLMDWDPRTTSWPPTHDNTFRYFWLVDHFHAALRAGAVYPRWLPEALSGYGSPIFVFYQPGFFWVASAVRELVAAPLPSMWLTLWLYMTLGGLGAYALARRHGPPLPALLLALLFLVTPYVATNLHVRGAVAEYAAMLLTPWPFVGLARLADGRGFGALLRALLLKALSLGVITLTHPAVALFLVPCLGVLALVRLRGHPEPWCYACTAVSAFVLALALSSVHWAPFLAMRSHVMFDDLQQGYFTASHHLVEPAQLVARSWGFGASVQGAQDGMAFQLGLPHLVLALGGLVVGRRRRGLWFGAGLYLLLIALMLPPSRPIWEHVTFLAGVQFPWRALSVVAVLQLLLSTGWLEARGAPLALGLGLVAALAWCPERLAPNPERVSDALARIEEHRATLRKSFYAYSEPTTDAVLPPTALRLREAGPRGDRPVLELDNGRRVRTLPDHSPWALHLAIEAGEPTTATLNQVHFAGWWVELDGRELDVDALELTPYGTMRLAIPAEAIELRAAYRGPPGFAWLWRLAAGIAVVTLVLWARMAARETRGGSAG